MKMLLVLGVKSDQDSWDDQVVLSCCNVQAFRECFGEGYLDLWITDPGGSIFAIEDED